MKTKIAIGQRWVPKRVPKSILYIMEITAIHSKSLTTGKEFKYRDGKFQETGYTSDKYAIDPSLLVEEQDQNIWTYLRGQDVINET